MVPVETELEKKRFSLLDYIREADTSHIVNKNVCIFDVFACVPKAAVPPPHCTYHYHCPLYSCGGVGHGCEVALLQSEDQCIKEVSMS